MKTIQYDTTNRTNTQCLFHTESSNKFEQTLPHTRTPSYVCALNSNVAYIITLSSSWSPIESEGRHI